MKDLNKQADFRDWLSLPLTQTFIDILLAEQEKIYQGANQYTFKNYHKKELDQTAVSLYGKVDGMGTVLSILETCKEEEPVIEIIDGQEVKTYPTIDGLFQQTYQKND